MSWDLVIIIVIGSGLLGLVFSKGRNPGTILSCSIGLMVACCIIVFLVIACQDLWILHNWLQTVK